MNICLVSGRPVRPAIAFGESKALKFVLATDHRRHDDPSKKWTSYVPCVVFDPTKFHQTTLCNEEARKQFVQGQGRISRTSYETSKGDRRYSTEVVLDPDTLVIRGGR